MNSGDQTPKITESAKKCVGGGEGEGRNIPKTRQIFGIKEEKNLVRQVERMRQ